MLTILILSAVTKFIMDSKIKRSHIISILSLIAVLAGLSVWAQGGGYLLYGEADWFLIDHNTSERSWLSKVICPHRHDAEHYMAREITHIVENIDARFVHACVKAGYSHFLSLSNYLFLGAISFAFWVVSRRHGMDRLLSILLIVLLWSSPPIFMSGAYIRSGHAFAAFLMTMLVLFIYHQSTSLTKMRRSVMWAITFTLSLLMVWSDRQGLFAACSIGLIVLIANPVGQRWTYCTALAAAITAHTFHYLFIGPWLIAHFTPFADVIVSSNPMTVAGANRGGGFIGSVASAILSGAYGGATIALSNVRLLFGNITYAMAMISIAAACWICRVKWIPAMVVMLIATMNCIMLKASDVMLWPDCLPSIYYHIISTVALWLVAGVCLLKTNPVVSRWLVVAMVAGNAFAISGHIEGFKRGHLVGFISGAPFLRAELNRTASIPSDRYAGMPVYNTLESCQFTGWKWVMKNPLEYGGKLTAEEFVESSQYLQFVRSERGIPFGRGGR
jgi:hypothetical protein